MKNAKHITNMVTMKIPHSSDVGDLLPFRKEQSKVYRLAYKLASYGLLEIQIRHDLKEKSINYNLTDSWLVQSAIKKAVGQFKAEISLDDKNGTKQAGKRIFGGKNNFLRRSKGLISKEEYQANRLENFRSIGEAPQSGNRKVIFDYDKIIIKPKSGTRIEVNLPNLRGEYKKDYYKLVEMSKNKKLPITVELNEKFVYIYFDKSLLVEEDVKPIIRGRYLGIDLNPNYIGVSIFNENKQVLDTLLFNFTSITGKKCNIDKLKHEIREVAIKIGKIAQHYQVEYLFLEDLSFKQGDKGLGKRYNRLVINQFLYTEFGRMLSKFGKVVNVNAAYSSTIGNIIHNEYPDPIASSMEIARRGIESRISKDSDKFYPDLPSNNRLLNQWKEAAGVEFDGWIQIHRWLKTTGVRYRVSIPSIEMFRPFVSKYSRVLVAS